MAALTRPCGLANLGNTCFLNALLQCLNASGLIDMMQEGEGVGRGAHGEVYAALKRTLGALRDPGAGRLLRPQSLVSAIHRHAPTLGRPNFSGWHQNDAAELYTMLAECIHEATKRAARVELTVTDDSRLTPVDKTCLDCITSFLRSEHSVASGNLSLIEAGVITDPSGGYLSSKASHLFILSVPVPPRATSVGDCVAAFGHAAPLTGADQFRLPDEHPNAGALVDAQQNMIVWLAPRMLVVETKLYAAADGRQGLRKGGSRLQAASTLDLPVWSAGVVSSVKYLLCGVVYHRGGGMASGHYTAVVRTRNGELWDCNDTAVSPLAKGRGWPAGGYCFFYRKIV